MQVAFWASLHLLHRLKWAVLGRPQPPIVHASPTVAALQACATAEEAAELSLKKGYSAEGAAPLPCPHSAPRECLESLPAGRRFAVTLLPVVFCCLVPPWLQVFW